MVTREQDAQEFLDQIAGKTYHYNIMLSGYGGEIVYGKATEDQWIYWNDKPDAFSDYMFDIEDETQSKDVPEEAKFDGEWYEQDGIAHDNGVEFDNGYINIVEMSYDDAGCFGKEVDSLVEAMSLKDFSDTYKIKVNETELDIDEHADSLGENYIFYGMSVEKGSFFDGDIQLTRPIDISKLSINTTSYPNGDTIVNSIEYDGETIHHEYGDTTGKSIQFEILAY
jgi:hypothetical protein